MSDARRSKTDSIALSFGITREMAEIVQSGRLRCGGTCHATNFGGEWSKPEPSGDTATRGLWR